VTQSCTGWQQNYCPGIAYQDIIWGAPPASDADAATAPKCYWVRKNDATKNFGWQPRQFSAPEKPVTFRVNGISVQNPNVDEDYYRWCNYTRGDFCSTLGSVDGGYYLYIDQPYERAYEWNPNILDQSPYTGANLPACRRP
jgi:hypothetical protein